MLVTKTRSLASKPPSTLASTSSMLPKGTLTASLSASWAAPSSTSAGTETTSLCRQRSDLSRRVRDHRPLTALQIYWGAHNSSLPSPRNKINNLGLSRKHLIEGTEAALARLQLSYVDIVYAHRPDRHTPIEETVRAFNFLINTGKALYWGTSEWLPSEIEEAWAVADKLGLIGPVVEQPGYSLLRREKVDDEFKNAKLFERRGLGLTVFSPLAGGLLTGKYIDGVPEDSRFKTSDDPYIQSVIKTIDTPAWKEQQDKIRALIQVAEKLGTDVATLSMAWVLSNKNVSSAITGASRPEQIFQTVRAVDVYRKLTPEVLEEIEGIFKNKPAEVTPRFGV